MFNIPELPANPEYVALSVLLIAIGVVRGYFGSTLCLIGFAIDSFVIGMFCGLFILYNCAEDISIAQSITIPQNNPKCEQ